MQIKTIDWSNNTSNSNDDRNLIQIDIHPTWLESFMSCPYKYHVQNDLDMQKKLNLSPNVFKSTKESRDIFYTWDLVEQVMTAYQYGDKLWDEVLKHFWNSTETWDNEWYIMMRSHAKLWKDYINNLPQDQQYIKDRYPLFTQKRMTLRILMNAPQDINSINSKSLYEIYIVWTADRVYSDYTIADCKSAKQKRWKNDVDYKLQCHIYPRMLKQISNHPSIKNKEDFRFTYYIFTKQKTPQLQVINFDWKYDNSERLVYHILSEYVKAHSSWNREPKKWLQCRRCPLRKVCPNYCEDWMASTTSTNSSSSGTDTPADWLNQVHTEPAQVSQEERRF